MRPMDLVDPFGRTVRDLRISVTDRCNFRCTYCMPAEGMQWLPREDILTFEEIERLARVCVERFGVDGLAPDRGRAHGAGPPARAGRQAGPPAGARRRSFPLCRPQARPVHHDERGHVPAAGARAARRGPGSGEHLAGHAQGRSLRRDDPAGRAAPRARRHRRRAGGGLRSGEGQRRGPAGRQRRRDRRSGRLRPGQRRRGSLHRVHAPGRQRALGVLDRGQPGRDRGGHRRRPPAGAGPERGVRRRPIAGATWTARARWG